MEKNSDGDNAESPEVNIRRHMGEMAVEDPSMNRWKVRIEPAERSGCWQKTPKNVGRAMKFSWKR